MPRSKEKLLLKGGKYLGAGTYGCGFNTKSKCISDGREQNLKENIEKNKRWSIATKRFFDKRYYEKEYHDLKKVQTIDPKSLFTVPLFGRCTTGKNQDKEYFMCSERDIGKQIVMGYGGQNIDIDDVNFTDKNIVAMWKGLPKLLQGLQKLHMKGFVHGDLKFDNLLFDVDMSRFNLIDFGLMTSTSKHDTPLSISRRKNYSWYPIETYLIRDIYHYVIELDDYNPSTFDVSKLIENLDENAIRSAYEHKWYQNHFPKDSIPLIKKAYQLFVQYYKRAFTRIKNKRGNQRIKPDTTNEYETNLILKESCDDAVKRIMKNLSDRYDIFGLGVVLMRYLSYGSSNIESLSNRGKETYIKIGTLARMMANPNWTQRLKIGNAMKEYTKIDKSTFPNPMKHEYIEIEQSINKSLDRFHKTTSHDEDSHMNKKINIKKHTKKHTKNKQEVKLNKQK